MAKKRQLIALIAAGLALVMAVATAVPMVYAWLSNPTATEASVEGSIKGSYFEDGKGTQAEPYIIARPIQLYYLAWLQDIGYFNQPYADDPETEDVDESKIIRQFYFKMEGGDYNNHYNATTAPDVVTDGVFDMSGWNLPPIGTTEYPFLGHFDGNNCTVSGLKTSNQFSVSDKQPAEGESTTGTQILGFFGVVGPYSDQIVKDGSGNETAGKIKIGETTYSYSSAANEIKNFLLDRVTVETASPTDQKSLVGIAAGYVNGGLSGIGVCESQIKVTDNTTGNLDDSLISSLSAYSLIGYSKVAVDAYVTATTTGGAANAWGGSVNMKTMHEKLNTSLGNATQSKYYSSITLVYDRDDNNKLISESKGGTATNVAGATASGNTYQFRSYSDDIAKYTFWIASNSGTYVYLAGERGSYTQAVTRIYYFKADFIRIGDGSGNYLTATASGVSNTTSVGTAQSWKLDSDGALYFTTGADYNMAKYYLNRSTAEETGLAVDTASNGTVWTLDNETETLSCNDGAGSPCYLFYVSGKWQLVAGKAMIRITDENGNYLSVASGAIQNKTSQSEASLWVYSGNYLYTVSGGTRYYLNANTASGLVLGPSGGTEWAFSGSQLTCSLGGTPYYAIFGGSAWSLVQNLNSTLTYISDGNGNYLRASGNATVANATALLNASGWTFSDGYLYTTVNGNRRYLNSNGTTGVQLGNQDTTWTYYNGEFYCTVGGVNYYLYCSGSTWAIKPREYLLHSGSNYLNEGTGNTPSVGNSADTATHWIVDSSGYYQPVGTSKYLGYYYRWGFFGTTQQLRVAISGNLSARMTYNATSQRMSCSYNYSTYYVRYNNGWTYTTDTRYAATITRTEVKIPITMETLSGNETVSSQNAASGLTVGQKATVNHFDFESETNNETTAGWDTKNSTYFPLSWEIDEDTSKPVVSEYNTGYVTSGKASASDIRVSKYGMNNISNSMCGSSTYDENKIEVLTIAWGDDGETATTYRIGDYQSKSESKLTDYTVKSAASLGFTKYSEAFGGTNGLKNTLSSDSEYIYGLHFMSGLISASNKIVAPYAKVNGTEYYHYELPLDCVNFTLQEAGKINFFAGTYFSSTVNYIFSLHQVHRDANGDIDWIKKISKIWGDSGHENNPEVIYEYSDGTFSDTKPAEYVCLFDMDWITKETSGDSLKQNALYYFEIPVNADEFALGAISSGNGAYLLYLDISANGGDIERDTYKYLKGIDFVDRSTVSTQENVTTVLAAIGTDTTPVAAFSLKTSFAGNTVKFTRTNGTPITVYYDSSSESGDIRAFKKTGVVTTYRSSS